MRTVKPRIDFITDRKISRRNYVEKLSAILLFMAVAFALNLIGCAASKDAPAAPSMTTSAAAKNVAPSKALDANDGTLALRDLTVRDQRGQTTLLMKFSQPVREYRHFPLQTPARLVLDVYGDVKPGQAEIYRIDTSAVATLRVNQVEGGLRLTTDIAAATVPTYTITQEDGGLRIVIGAENPNATARKDATIVRGGVRTDIRAAEGGAVATGAASKSLASDKVAGDDKKYTGQKISLDFKDADIKNVFRLLGEVSGKNLVVTDDVNKKVTIRLIEVPWDQALDLIIDTNGLAKEEVGSVMRISTATRLSAEKRQQQEARNASRSAEIPQLSYLTVNYAKAKDLADKVKLLIKGGAELVPDDRSNFIVVRGSKTDLEEAVEIVTRLDVRTPQVLIESNIIETTPTFSRALGIEMEGLFNQGRVRTSDRFVAGPPFAGGPQPTPTVNQLIIPTSGFRWGYFGNNITSVLSETSKLFHALP